MSLSLLIYNFISILSPYSHLLKKRRKRLRGFRRQVTIVVVAISVNWSIFCVILTQNLKFPEVTVSTCAIFKKIRCCAWNYVLQSRCFGSSSVQCMFYHCFSQRQWPSWLALILLPAFPPPSDDFEASYAVAFRGVVRRRWIRLLKTTAFYRSFRRRFSRFHPSIARE